MKKFVKLFILFLCINIIFLLPQFLKPFSEASYYPIEETVKKEILSKKIIILPQFNHVNVGFNRVEDTEYYYIKSINKIFYQEKPLEVVIKNITFLKDSILLGLFNDIFGSGEIIFYFKEDKLKKATASSINKILITTLSDKNHSKLYCNKKTKTFHLPHCNHLPEKEDLICMDYEEANNLGFKPCAFCFEKLLYLPESSIENELEVLSTAQTHYYGPILLESEKKEYISKVAHEILKNWPFKLLVISDN